MHIAQLTLIRRSRRDRSVSSPCGYCINSVPYVGSAASAYMVWRWLRSTSPETERQTSGSQLCHGFPTSTVAATPGGGGFILWCCPWRHCTGAGRLPGRVPAMFIDVRDGGMMGNVSENVLPAPMVLSTQILPPCASTIDFAIHNPRPDPGARQGPRCVRTVRKSWIDVGRRSLTRDRKC